MIIRNARVITLDSANRVLDSGAVEILPDGSIGQVEDTLVGLRGAPWRAPTTPPLKPPHDPLLIKEGS